MPELGRAALVVTLGLSVYALVAGAAAARLGRRRLAYSAQNALVAAFFSTLVAAGVLLAALLRNDFSFTYVARTTSEALPTAYTISAFWGGQEGSLLLWLLMLTGFGAVAVRLNRSWARSLVVWVVPVFAAVGVFFSFLLVAVASLFLLAGFTAVSMAVVTAGFGLALSSRPFVAASGTANSIVECAGMSSA